MESFQLIILDFWKFVLQYRHSILNLMYANVQSRVFRRQKIWYFLTSISTSTFLPYKTSNNASFTSISKRRKYYVKIFVTIFGSYIKSLARSICVSLCKSGWHYKMKSALIILYMWIFQENVNNRAWIFE